MIGKPEMGGITGMAWHRRMAPAGSPVGGASGSKGFRVVIASRMMGSNRIVTEAGYLFSDEMGWDGMGQHGMAWYGGVQGVA